MSSPWRSIHLKHVTSENSAAVAVFFHRRLPDPFSRTPTVGSVLEGSCGLYEANMVCPPYTAFLVAVPESLMIRSCHQSLYLVINSGDSLPVKRSWGFHSRLLWLSWSRTGKLTCWQPWEHVRRTFVTVFALLLLDVVVDPSLPLPGSGRLKEMGTTDDRKVCGHVLWDSVYGAKRLPGLRATLQSKNKRPKKT